MYRFNGNANDASGNGNNGTDVNVSYGQQYGRINGGASFNGTSSQVTVPIANFPTGNLTIHVAVRHNSTYNYPGPCVYGGTVNSRSWFLFVNAGDSPPNYRTVFDYFYITDHISEIPNPTKDASILANQFHNLTGIFYYSAPYYYFQYFMDGKSPGALNSYSMTYYLPIDFIIGGAGQWWLRWNGEIDEFIIDDTAWSPAKIRNKYAADKGFF